MWECEGYSKIDLLEKSDSWSFTIDDGMARSRAFDRYLKIDTIPKNPRWYNIFKVIDTTIDKFSTNTDASIIEDDFIKLLKIVDSTIRIRFLETEHGGRYKNKL